MGRNVEKLATPMEGHKNMPMKGWLISYHRGGGFSVDLKRLLDAKREEEHLREAWEEACKRMSGLPVSRGAPTHE